MAQGVLSDDAKLFVVQQLACFDTPSEVAKAVKEEFSIEISRQAVEVYDPTKRAGASLSAEYRDLFYATRKAFLEDTAAIGIANRSVRLRKIQRLFDLAMQRGNVVAAASLLEQAAKESGGAFTNRREMTGADGKSVAIAVAPDLSRLDQKARDGLRSIAEQLARGSGGDAPGA